MTIHPSSIGTSSAWQAPHIVRLSGRRWLRPERRLTGLREDGAVPSSVETCVVCHRLRSDGSRNPAGNVFVCTQCEADADQLLAIQDEIWPQVGVADDPTGGGSTPAQP